MIGGLSSLGKTLVVLGGMLIVVGVLLILSEKLNFTFLGKLPGDVHVKGKNFQFYFPITTSIILSILLTLVMYAISLFSKK